MSAEMEKCNDELADGGPDAHHNFWLIALMFSRLPTCGHTRLVVEAQPDTAALAFGRERIGFFMGFFCRSRWRRIGSEHVYAHTHFKKFGLS